MAIDRTGISSLDTGASDITYTGNEGPKSPQQQQMMAQLEQEYEQYKMEQIEIDPSQVLSFEEWYQSVIKHQDKVLLTAEQHIQHTRNQENKEWLMVVLQD